MKSSFGQSDFGTEAALHMQSHENSVRGNIRYEVVKANLGLYLPNSPINVIDIGGGSGRDSSWLASKGHYVTLVDPGKEQIEAAEEKRDELPKKAQENFTIVRGNLDDSVKEGKTYDLVLAHCVAMYSEKHKKFVSQLSKLCVEGGILSSLEKNNKARRAELGPGGGLRYNNFMSDGWIKKNRAGKKAYAFKKDELESLITGADFDILAWFGVTVRYNNIPQDFDQFSKASFANMLDIEIDDSRDDTTKGAGQLLHFVARKR